MIKISVFLLTLAFLIFSQASSVSAHCPLCVAGAGAGLTLSRVLGIDDSVTGVWLGGFLGALAFWAQRLLGQRNKTFLTRWVGILIYVLFFAVTIWSFYRFNLVVRHGDIFGFDKLTFGIILGGLVFYIADLVNALLRKKDGKALFPYQSVVFSLSSIVITSFGVYILINYFI
jgi:hypothetical protein